MYNLLYLLKFIHYKKLNVFHIDVHICSKNFNNRRIIFKVVFNFL